MHVEKRRIREGARACCFALASTMEPLSHSLTRHRLPAALVAAKNCTLHFGNVVGMYRVFPFAAPGSIRSTRTVRRARGFALGSGRLSLPLRLNLFFPLADRFVESPIFLLAMTARSSRGLAEILREISRFRNVPIVESLSNLWYNLRIEREHLFQLNIEYRQRTT